MKDIFVKGHIQLGDTDTFNQPPGFNVPDNAETESGHWGREMGVEEQLIDQDAEAD